MVPHSAAAALLLAQPRFDMHTVTNAPPQLTYFTSQDHFEGNGQAERLMWQIHCFDRFIYSRIQIATASSVEALFAEAKHTVYEMSSRKAGV